MKRQSRHFTLALIIALLIVIILTQTVFVTATHNIAMTSNASNGTTWLKGGTNQSFNFTIILTGNSSTNLTNISISNLNFTLNLTAPTINATGWTCSAPNATLVNCSSNTGQLGTANLTANITILVRLLNSSVGTPLNQTNYTWTITTLDNFSGTNSSTWLTEVDAVAPKINLSYTNATQKKSTDILTLNISVNDSSGALSNGSGVSACNVSVAGQSSNQTIAYSSGWCNTTTFSLTSSTAGNSTINVYANDTVNNFGLNNSFVVWIDDTAPTIKLPVYTNATKYKNTQSMQFNISVTDAGGGTNSSCYVNVNGSANWTITGIAFGWCNGTYASLAGMSDGNKTIYAYATDNVGNMALNSSFVVWIDSTAPTVSLTSPADNYFINSTSNSIIFNCTAYDYDNVSLKFANITLYGTWNGTWLANLTNSTPVNNTPFNNTINNTVEGTYVWNCGVCDSLSNCNFSASNRTFTVDATYPAISFGDETEDDYANISRNWTYADVSYTEINFANITFTLYNDEGLVDSEFYDLLNNTNYTNWTDLVEDNYTYEINITDAANNKNSTGIRRITLDTTAPAINFSCSSDSVFLDDDELTCSCNGSDDASGVNDSATIYNETPSTSTKGTHTATCTITDYANNSGSSSIDYVVLGHRVTYPSGGGGAGGATTNQTTANQTANQTTNVTTVSRKPTLVPGKGLINNTKLQAALEKVIAKGKLSQQALENIQRLSASITQDTELTRNLEVRANKSKLEIKIKNNGDKTAKNFALYDKLPKTFANTSDDINVTASGATIEIVEEDPEYLFLYPELKAGQEISIIYEVNKKINTSVIDNITTELYAGSLEKPPVKTITILVLAITAIVVIILAVLWVRTASSWKKKHGWN